jgi:hypothetical protein
MDSQKILNEFLARACSTDKTLAELFAEDIEKNPVLGKSEMTALLNAKFSYPKPVQKVKAKFGFDLCTGE